MKLIVYVHDFSRQIGHSRAMIEVIDQLQPQQVKVVCYSHAPIKEINLNQTINYKFIKVPFGGLKPFLLRNLFFQLYTSILYKIWTRPDERSISIGVCTFIAEIINVQFAHFLWEKLYFKASPIPWYKKIYKVILLKYLTLSEDFCYQNNNLKFVFLSGFIKDAFVSRYGIYNNNYCVAYSSTNANQFSPSSQSRTEKLEKLKNLYPQLKGLSLSRPTVLFVGAFERKGLPLFAHKVSSGNNFIIVGSPEASSKFTIPDSKNVFHISFSKHINLFYDFCDLFIFPTLYEPFGLVLLEAALSGMKIVTSKHMVGASELLRGIDHVKFCDPFMISPQELKILAPLKRDERLNNSETVREAIKSYTWENCSQQWNKLLVATPN